MTMYEAIKDFPKQFEFNPVIENKNKFFISEKIIVAGMGGSQLGAELLKSWDSSLDIISHKDYGLPNLTDDDLRTRLVIISSYSGNTEETLDSFMCAMEKKLNVIVITTGGKLLELAKIHGISYIALPSTDIQPRCAIGFNMKALLKAMGKAEAFREVSSLASSLKSEDFEELGKILAQKLNGFIPIIYASSRNRGIAYNWKIKLNETGKIPAFYNVFPELNHNEMNSFDVGARESRISQKFHFILLRDYATDHKRILKRMDTLKKLYEKRRFFVTIVDLAGENIFYKLFSAVIMADWTAYYTALQYNMDPEQVYMVEEFKKNMN